MEMHVFIENNDCNIPFCVGDGTINARVPWFVSETNISNLFCIFYYLFLT